MIDDIANENYESAEASLGCHVKDKLNLNSPNSSQIWFESNHFQNNSNNEPNSTRQKVYVNDELIGNHV